MRRLVCSSIVFAITVSCCLLIVGCHSLPFNLRLCSKDEGLCKPETEYPFPKVTFEGEDRTAELIIIPRSDYFLQGVKGQTGETRMLFFTIWNASKKPIAVVTGPHKIVFTQYFHKRTKKPITNQNDASNLIIPVGDSRAYLGTCANLILLRGFGNDTGVRVLTSYFDFDYELVLPESDENELDAHIEFQIAVFAGDRVKWFCIDKVIPVRLEGERK